MAWLTSYDSSNKVEIIPAIQHPLKDIGTYVNAFGVLYTVREQVYESHYQYVGMDKATAITCAAAQVTATSAYDGKVRVLFRGGGRYDVDVNIYYVTVSEVAS